ncbi:hypothetical protein Prudu_002797 [Prunus dulcis]|uniref:Nucleotidylyl transferase superfamily protein n=1 Tax=Prunus dulcis TaxID=3755 RepID=A0A4Y1QRM6_PRUDU|nr:hypothetical protein Prudu_002797 [Prunus dulcis]
MVARRHRLTGSLSLPARTSRQKKRLNKRRKEMDDAEGRREEKKTREGMIISTGLKTVVEAIHASPTQSVLYLSGGASQAVAWLLSVPGASSTVLEAVVPYSRMSMIQLLGKIPNQFCSSHTAEEMALLAYNRALKLSSPGSPVVGVGFTGTLATSRPKLGSTVTSQLSLKPIC